MTPQNARYPHRSFRLAGLGVGLCLCLHAKEAEATVTRIYTLGGMNRFILDDANRWIFPHVIGSYSNLFYIDLFGAEASRSFENPAAGRLASGRNPIVAFDRVETVPVQNTAGGGAIIRVVGGLSLGIHLSDYESNVVPNFLSLLSTYSDGDPSSFPWLFPNQPDALQSSNRKLDVFAAFEFEKLARIGLSFSYGSSSYTYEPDADEEGPLDTDGERLPRLSDEIGTSEIGFVVSGELSPAEKLAFELAFGLSLYDLTYRPNQLDDLLAGGDGTLIRADFRARIGLGDIWEIVPAMTFRRFGMSGSDEGSFVTGLPYDGEGGRDESFITDLEIGQTIFDGGVAGHMRPLDAIDFWVALGIQYATQFSEARHAVEGPTPDRERLEESWLALPYIRLALEAAVFEWLDLRAGLVKFIEDETERTELEERDVDPEQSTERSTSRDDPFFDYYLGFAAHHAGFFLDFQLNPQWFRTGPHFLSGASAGNMFVNVSLGYKF